MHFIDDNARESSRWAPPGGQGYADAVQEKVVRELAAFEQSARCGWVTRLYVF